MITGSNEVENLYQQALALHQTEKSDEALGLLQTALLLVESASNRRGFALLCSKINTLKTQIEDPESVKEIPPPVATNRAEIEQSIKALTADAKRLFDIGDWVHACSAYYQLVSLQSTHRSHHYTQIANNYWNIAICCWNLAGINSATNIELSTKCIEQSDYYIQKAIKHYEQAKIAKGLQDGHLTECHATRLELRKWALKNNLRNHLDESFFKDFIQVLNGEYGVEPLSPQGSISTPYQPLISNAGEYVPPQGKPRLIYAFKRNKDGTGMSVKLLDDMPALPPSTQEAHSHRSLPEDKLPLKKRILRRLGY